MNGIGYVLDANVFIEAARRYYAFDLVPAFWDALIHHARNGRVLSIDRVKEELKRGHDDLAEWAKTDFAGWFVSTAEEAVIDCYRSVMAWVQNQNQLSDPAKADFASGAYGWPIAFARTHGYVVVTQEQLDGRARRKVPIPNVCLVFNVKCVDTFSMLRELGVRLG